MALGNQNTATPSPSAPFGCDASRAEVAEPHCWSFAQKRCLFEAPHRPAEVAETTEASAGSQMQHVSATDQLAMQDPMTTDAGASGIEVGSSRAAVLRPPLSLPDQQEMATNTASGSRMVTIGEMEREFWTLQRHVEAGDRAPTRAAPEGAGPPGRSQPISENCSRAASSRSGDAHSTRWWPEPSSNRGHDKDASSYLRPSGCREARRAILLALSQSQDVTGMLSVDALMGTERPALPDDVKIVGSRRGTSSKWDQMQAELDSTMEEAACLESRLLRHS